MERHVGVGEGVRMSDNSHRAASGVNESHRYMSQLCTVVSSRGRRGSEMISLKIVTADAQDSLS